MEILFTWLSDAFSVSTCLGFGAIGVSLSGLFAFLYAMYWVGLCLWCFVEDAKIEDKAVKCLLDREDNYEKGRYHLPPSDIKEEWYKAGSRYYPKGSETYVLGCVCGALPPVVMVVLPLGGLLLGAIIQGIMFLPVLSSIVVSILLAILGARGIRRLQKKLNMHLSDDNTHSKDKDDEATT